jgi:hypothetical protein
LRVEASPFAHDGRQHERPVAFDYELVDGVDERPTGARPHDGEGEDDECRGGRHHGAESKVRAHGRDARRHDRRRDGRLTRDCPVARERLRQWMPLAEGGRRPAMLARGRQELVEDVLPQGHRIPGSC